MRVRMLVTAAGPVGVCIAGETWDVPASMAQQLLDGGYAVPAEVVSRETATAPAPAEAAVMPPASKRRPARS